MERYYSDENDDYRTHREQLILAHRKMLMELNNQLRANLDNLRAGYLKRGLVAVDPYDDDDIYNVAVIPHKK